MKTNTNLVYFVLFAGLVSMQQVAVAGNSSLSESFSSAFKSAIGSVLKKEEVSPKNISSSKRTKSRSQSDHSTGSIGIATTTANVRSRPSKDGEKIGVLIEGNEARVIGAQGNWSNIAFSSQGKSVVGWIYTPLLRKQNTGAGSGGTAIPAALGGSKGQQNIEYIGYSKSFQSVKSLMETGDPAGAKRYFVEEEKVLREKAEENDVKINTSQIDNIGMLGWVERGTINLDAGNLGQSIESFDNAETILDVRQKRSKLVGFLGSAGSFIAESLSGNEEISEYRSVGYEKVLILNYKSIAYLLNGERKAYNVARRAIDWQNMEKKKFDQDLRKSKARLEKEKKKNKDASVSDQYNDWQNSYKKLDSIAEKVPSAYVNPFGYYVSGMIQEFESRDDQSLRENARISYEKGMELNPGSDVLREAAEDMRKPYDSSKRLVHVVVGDGFVPEKKMLIYNIATPGGVVPIKLSIYEPVLSKVYRVEIQTTSGKKLATLSTVADVEALSLRHQKDLEEVRALRVGVSITRAIGVIGLTSRMGSLGTVLGDAFNDLAAPDTRSWMSLPGNMRAARIKVRKSLSKIKVVSYGKNGRKLVSKTVVLNKKSDNFIYVRSIGKQLYVHVSKPLWL